MEAAPVPLAQDPGQHIHFEVQLMWKLRADQVRRACAFTSRDQPSTVVVTTVLSCKSRRVAGKCWANAAAGWRLVDVQALLGAAGIAPSERSAVSLIVDADHRVCYFGRVGAGAAGQLRQHLVEVLLEEITLAIEPFLTAVNICGKRTMKVKLLLMEAIIKSMLIPWSQIWILSLTSLNICRIVAIVAWSGLATGCLCTAKTVSSVWQQAPFGALHAPKHLVLNDTPLFWEVATLVQG